MTRLLCIGIYVFAGAYITGVFIDCLAYSTAYYGGF